MASDLVVRKRACLSYVASVAPCTRPSLVVDNVNWSFRSWSTLCSHPNPCQWHSSFSHPSVSNNNSHTTKFNILSINKVFLRCPTYHSYCQAPPDLPFRLPQQPNILINAVPNHPLSFITDTVPINQRIVPSTRPIHHYFQLLQQRPRSKSESTAQQPHTDPSTPRETKKKKKKKP